MPFTPDAWRLFVVLLLIALVSTGVMMLTLAELHERISHPRVTRWDDDIQDDVHDDMTRGHTREMFALSRIGSPQVLGPVIPLLAAFLWLRRLRHAAVVWLIATGGAVVLVTLLKLHFKRARPDLPWAFVHEPTYSFPSGHSVFAVVVYGMLVYLGLRHLPHAWQRVAICAAAVAMIVGIGLSRIYLGVHYPSDVAAGYFVGLVWLLSVIGSDLYVLRFRARMR
jgi:undecaprenyl-diphosphatase